MIDVISDDLKTSLLSLDVNPTNFVAIASYYEDLTGSKLKSIKN